MIVVAWLALAAWIYLFGFHGRFWQYGPVLPDAVPAELPDVAIVVPARDEAAVIRETLRSLLAQDYAGGLRIILVDDNSTDGTAAVAAELHDPRLTIVTGAPRPNGWSGKLWAVQQGVTEAENAELILLTDADIVHEPSHLRTLVAQQQCHRLEMVSEMVRLACDSLAEKALVPAFVFFFQLLYPFEWVNDGMKATAAAAGGTILIRRQALQRIGGIEALKGALIDDVSLARAVKKGGRIWLGHTDRARSIRLYPDFGDVWRMIARTAYVQLRFSPVLLILTTLAMGVVWIAPPALALGGTGAARGVGVLAWILMSLSYLPTLWRYGRALPWVLALPLVALFYMAATIGSAVNHYSGRGVAWKGRAYQDKTG